MANSVNPNNNSQKQNDILELWYRLTGQIKGKVNLARNSDVAEIKPANKTDHLKQVENKSTKTAAEHTIVVENGQNLHIVNLSNSHNFDLTNQEKGLTDRTNFKAIKAALSAKNPKDKTVVVFGGNFIGYEWVMSNLNNASINEQGRVLFWGLKARIDEFIKSVRYCAENGADEIILLNSREEHNVLQKLNFDIIREVCNKKLNNNQKLPADVEDFINATFNDYIFNYVVEEVNNKSKKTNLKNVSISYVRGVKKVFNIKKKTAGKDIYYTMAFLTNLKSNSTKFSSTLNAVERQHAGLPTADVIFVTSENVAGIPDKSKNLIFTSGLSQFQRTTKGNMPANAPKDFNTFTLMMDEKEHDMEVVRRSTFTNPKTYNLEREIAIEQEKIAILADVAKQKINEKLNNVADIDYDYSKISYGKQK